jgi:hypothetical protein
MGDQFKAAVRSLDCKDIGCVVLTGAGRAFSAGGDFQFLRDRHHDTPSRNAQIMRQFYERFLSCKSVETPICQASDTLLCMLTIMLPFVILVFTFNVVHVVCVLLLAFVVVLVDNNITLRLLCTAHVECARMWCVHSCWRVLLCLLAIILPCVYLERGHVVCALLWGFIVVLADNNLTLCLPCTWASGCVLVLAFVVVLADNNIALCLPTCVCVYSCWRLLLCLPTIILPCVYRVYVGLWCVYCFLFFVHKSIESSFH